MSLSQGGSILAIEDPGTVPASANGRGYSFLGTGMPAVQPVAAAPRHFGCESGGVFDLRCRAPISRPSNLLLATRVTWVNALRTVFRGVSARNASGRAGMACSGNRLPGCSLLVAADYPSVTDESNSVAVARLKKRSTGYRTTNTQLVRTGRNAAYCPDGLTNQPSTIPQSSAPKFWPGPVAGGRSHIFDPLVDHTTVPPASRQ